MRFSLALVTICLLATSRDVAADAADPYDAGTMAAQAGGGIVGAIVGATVVGLAGAGIGSLSASRSNWGPPLAGAVIGGVIGGLGGTVVGVKLTGDSQDASGGWAGTSLGMAGGVVGVALVVAVAEKTGSKVPPLAMITVGMTLLVAGPVIGYQITNDGPDAATRERRFSITVPVVAF